MSAPAGSSENFDPPHVRDAREGGGSATVSIALDRQAPARARQYVRRMLESGRIDDDVRGTVELLINEVVTNLMQHEDTTGVEIAIVVGPPTTVTLSGRIGIADQGVVQPPGVPASVSRTGRGLNILDALATSWGTHRGAGRAEVWFTVDGPSDDATQQAGSATGTAGGDLAALTAEQAAVGAAATAAAAARNARLARAAAAVVAAEGVAEAAARTVAAVQAQAEELAAAVAEAAAQAAATVSSSIRPGTGDGGAAARAAVRVSATVMAAAAEKADETARAAILVAGAVAAAASSVAATAAAEDAAIEVQVADAAFAVQAVTAATASRLASDALERGMALALAARNAVEASERLKAANQELLIAGRHDRTIALALQAAMLTQLPTSPQLQLAARYLTAAEHDQVGGDWYDALVLPGRPTTLVIGDIMGHDIAAAAVMGQVRNLLRALVWDRDDPPSAVVTRLDQALRDLDVETLATMVVVNVEEPEPSTPGSPRTLRWTNAGHPAPILVHADGTAVALEDTTDILLGVRPNATRRDHRHVVPPGATLLLYTDGLIETRDAALQIGLERLLDVASTHYLLEPDELLDAVLADMVGNRPDDDVAVLAVRFVEP